MTRDDVRAILQRHQDALNRHDVADLPAMYADDAVLISPMFHPVRGRQAIDESFVRRFRCFRTTRSPYATVAMLRYR